MIKVRKELGKYFILVSVFSIAFILIISNISITHFFSDYIKEMRAKNDYKIVQYVERFYSDGNGMGYQSLMNIMHYAFSESVTIRIRDNNNNMLWSSGTPETMHDMFELNTQDDNSLQYQGYPFNYNGERIGTIEVGRPKSLISSLEERDFLLTINGIFIIAFIFSVIIAVLLSLRTSLKFLKPIYQIKENAKLIEDGKYKKLIDISTNTYELHDLSVSIKKLAERLDYQEELRRRMTTDIAHELRTPLATLQSHVEALMDGVWKPNSEKFSIIHNEIIRLTKLIKELSDLSVIESDEIKLEKNFVDLSNIINDITESFEPLFVSKNITLKKDVQQDVLIYGDIDRLSRIFTNILSNAFKYTNEYGNVCIELKDSDDVIRLLVEDTGIGIPKQDIKHVFERFYRSDLSRSRKTGGTGIGLTISKALIEAHNGKIEVKSEEGKGTKVYIYFKKSS